ncbi:hypothetical protein OQA88_11167 [Cercophora sp. LCS_1]
MASTPHPKVDLHAPFTSDTLLEIRSGKMKPLPGSNVLSGIDKTPLTGPVYITPLGIEGDEHDYTFHGGPDKALLGFCSSHYEPLQQEYPAAASAFVPGGFGENLVTTHMNERNVCIGDVIGVGDELLLEVSLPRQPCFKLNQRFHLPNFAVTTWKTSRTGWYYRVLRPGNIQAGDAVRLVERRHPEWTIESIQEYLHRDTTNAAMNAQLAEIEELGLESKNQFKKRVARQRALERKARDAPKWRDFKVVERKAETPRIVSFVLEAVEPLPEGVESELDLGAHAKIKLGNGLVRAYSVVDGNKNRFRLGISLDREKSRGGSVYMHDVAKVGHTVQVGALTAGIPLRLAAGHHIFVAAGVGLTAFMSLIERMVKINYSVVLHYAVRCASEIPFRDRLEALGSCVVIYDKSAGQRLSLPDILAGMKWNSHIYFCGPKRLMDEAAKGTKAHCIPDTGVHFEAFEANISGDPFEAVVANKGNKVLSVGEEETLLEVLQKHFGEVDSSCSVGNCGTCRVGLKEGRVDHRGTALTEGEKATSILSCVSRGIGRIVVEI